MTVRADTDQTADAWVRLSWVWTAILLISLLLPTGLFWLGTDRPAQTLPQVALLVAAIGVLHWFFVILLPRRQSNQIDRLTLFHVLYVLLLAVCVWRLILIHPIFYFSVGGFFGQIFYVLPVRRALPVVLLLFLALGFLGSETGGLSALRGPDFWIWVVSGSAATLFALWISAIIDQSNERRELIQQLQQAQVELARAERQAGVLEERQRLAREIHDTLAQGFISIVTHLEAAEQALPTDLPKTGHHLTQASTTARASLREARRVVQDLRPEILAGATLPTAISRVAADWSRSSQIEANVTITGIVQPLGTEIEVALLRAAQEALSNVEKHSGATEANLTLSYLPDRVMLDVQDDGQGMPAAQTDGLKSSGFGLQAMRERVEKLAGNLYIESEPQAGTTITLDIPYSLETEAASSALDGEKRLP